MADTAPPETYVAGAATLAPPATAKPRRLGSDIVDDRAECWHRHVAEDADEIHQEMVRAREVLHTGTSADAVALADEDIEERAIAAAGRWRNS